MTYIVLSVTDGTLKSPFRTPASLLTEHVPMVSGDQGEFGSSTHVSAAQSITGSKGSHSKSESFDVILISCIQPRIIHSIIKTVKMMSGT